MAETSQDGRDYKLHLVTQEAVASFWAVRKVTLEYCSGDVRGRKAAYVFFDYDLPTVTIDVKTHELSDTLFVGKPEGERKFGTWEHVWIATCIWRNRFDPGESSKPN